MPVFRAEDNKGNFLEASSHEAAWDFFCDKFEDGPKRILKIKNQITEIVWESANPNDNDCCNICCIVLKDGETLEDHSKVFHK